MRAVEEILANAVYHRSYQVPEPITVRVTAEGMEIMSFPGFARAITDADIAARSIRGRVYRNRRIGDFLKELRLIEGRNTGFRKILRTLEHNGSPLPEFETDEERSYFITRLRRHPAFADAADYETTGKSSDKSSDKGSDKSSDKTTSHRQKIIQVLEAKGRAQAGELARVIGLAPAGTRKVLSRMVAEGLIEAHGERRGRYYCLPESKDMPC
jgi:ATP-dependent DNA helicase RecG